ncbi:tRNA guanine-1-methyltransferase [Nitzschia inconspicua]|uniref:tRNA (guanine(9)-N(1))-methyltransferase n=1 Tax=Nitzschia inconspicua TaxID=303405 RepID=A0A9K3PJL7_9STRA|nr:tRNA guanine-1-methyltransferase [Nitzschia inconspicua]
MSAEGGNEQLFDTEKKSDGMNEPVHVPSVMSHESTTQDEDPSTAKPTTASPSEVGETAPKMSKNQLKRKRKLEKLMEQKRQKKEQQKCLKSAKAKVEGRDIEAERHNMEQRRLSGEGWTKRQEKWRKNFDTQGGKFQVCLDCSFEDQMTYKELNSLASQIRYCYATNRRAKHPVRVTVTSLRGKTQEILQNVAGVDRWEHREFYQTDKDVLSAYYPDKARLVYLTSDSTNILQTLEDDKIYIIGGIVDRNRLKRATIDRAESLGIATAKLPISDHLDITATKVLTCNHVFDILVKWKECNKDWKKTLLEVLPNRKDAKEKS